MDVSQLLHHLAQSAGKVLLHGPAAAPLWAAAVWLVLLFYRRRVSRFLCLLFGIHDSELVAEVVSKVDVTFQSLLVSLAVLPFLALVPGRLTPEIVRIGSLLTAFLAVHATLRGLDVILSHWYQSRWHVSMPAVFRCSALGIIYLVLGLLLLDWTMGVNVLPLLATSSVIAAVLGLALQDTLRNVFAGLTMSLEKTVKQGDWVDFRVDQEHNRLGQVMEIGWRSTKIRTLNDNLSVIPNTMFIQGELINYDSPSSTNARAVDFPVTIALEPGIVLKELVAATRGVEGVLDEPPVEASARDVKIDQVVYQLRFWLNGVKRREAITSDVITACWTRIAALQADRRQSEDRGQAAG